MKLDMKKIITTSELQKKIGQISQTIDTVSYIVTQHGRGKFVILPYCDGCDEMMEDYLEDCEMMQNREVLKKRFQESHDSGLSDLVI